MVVKKYKKLIILAKSAYFTKKYNKSIKLYQKALKICPKRLEALQGLLKVQCAMKKYNDALKTLKKFRDAGGSLSHFHYYAAIIFEKKKDYKRSLNHYNKVLAIKKSAPILIKKGNILERMGKYHEAAKFYKEACQILKGELEEALDDMHYIIKKRTRNRGGVKSGRI